MGAQVSGNTYSGIKLTSQFITCRNYFKASGWNV